MANNLSMYQKTAGLSGKHDLVPQNVAPDLGLYYLLRLAYVNAL